MKKIVINISDMTYEKLRFESIEEKKSIQQVIESRIFTKSFSENVLNAFDKWLEEETQKIIRGEK